MECFTFSEIFEIPKSSIEFGHGGSIQLKNQYGVFVFQDIREKMQFYDELRASALNSGSNDSQRTPAYPGVVGVPSIIVMECGSSSMELYNSTKPSDMKFTVCRDSQDLVNCLRSILDNTSPSIDSNLNTLVIENISAFYWQHKVANSREFYREVNKLIGQMMKRYACNVIVTTWSTAFERGFNSNPTDPQAASIAEATYTPQELFRGASLAYFNKRQLEI